VCAGGFFQACPGGGGTSQTAVNKQSGAKSQPAALTTALTVALTLLFLAPLVSLIPQPTLATLVLVAAAGLIQVGEFMAIGQYRRTELIWALVALDWLIFGNLDSIAKHLDKSRLAVTEAVFGVLLAALAVQLALQGLADLGVIDLMGH